MARGHEEDDLSIFLDAQQELVPSFPGLGSSHSSGRSSRGCTPPLASLSWTGSHGSSKSKSGSPSNRSKNSDDTSSSSKSRKNKKKSLKSIKNSSKSSSKNGASLDSSVDTSANSSVFSPAQTSSQPTTPSARASSKNSYFPSTSSFTSYTSVERKKKKSWVSSAMTPNYRQRCDEVKKNFPGLPHNEMLIGDYSCALQKDILVHGRVYITTNYLCFYANIFRWETAVTISWKEVTAMTKEKTALVIPNAVQICTGSDKYFFTSFAARDKTHVLMFRLWQNSLLDNPAMAPELWSWVRSVYGDKTERYNGSETNYQGDESNDAASNCSFDGIEMAAPFRQRQYSNILEEEEKEAGRDKVDSKDAEKKSQQDGSVTDQSDNSSSVTRLSETPQDPVTSTTSAPLTDILTYQVWRQSKVARQFISRNFDLNIDDLFTLLFTNSKFFYDFQSERKTFDIVQCPWQHSDQSDDKYREVSYTLHLNHPIGPKTSRATEVQTMRQNSVPGHIYNVDVETTNADIPYADHFYVATHYCLVKVSESESFLTVLCDIKYKKSPWGLIKSFIEKNCWAGIEEHYSALSEALERDIETRIAEEEKNNSANLGNKKVKTRRQRNQRRTSASDGNLSTAGGSGAGQVGVVSSSAVFRRQEVAAFTNINTVTTGGTGPRREDGQMIKILLLLLAFLCILNVFLVFKMWSLEHKLSVRSESLDEQRLFSPEVPETTGDWLDVLRRQEARHREELSNWRIAVDAASSLLERTERSMVSLASKFTSEQNSQILNNLLKINANTYKTAVLKNVIDKEL